MEAMHHRNPYLWQNMWGPKDKIMLKLLRNWTKPIDENERKIPSLLFILQIANFSIRLHTCSVNYLKMGLVDHRNVLIEIFYNSNYFQTKSKLLLSYALCSKSSNQNYSKDDIQKSCGSQYSGILI